MSAFSDIDRINLEELALKHPHAAIHLTNTFFGGTDKQDCGFVPNDWNGKTLIFSYKDK